MGTLFKIALLAMAMVFAASLQANDLLKALDTISKAVDGTSAPSVKSVVMATGFTDGIPSGVATSFPPDTKRVYACYSSAGAVGNVQLQADWYYGKDGSLAKITSSSNAMAKSGSVGEFHLEVASGKLPVGSYKVELLVQGKVIGGTSFKVDEAIGSGAVWNGAAGTTGSVWNGGASQTK